MTRISEGLLNDGIPYLAVGDGPPVVVVEGLTPTHEVPTGWARRMALASAKPLSSDFRVYVVNRKQGLRPGSTMSDLAGHLATAIEDEIGTPVLLTGASTGGSIALQLAVDRPDLVRSLVVVAAAYRLGSRGRRLQAELARMTRDGDAAGGWARLMTAALPPVLQGPAQPMARALMRSMAPADPNDLLVTIEAEDSFDVGHELHRISAPTLVVAGGRDVFYTRELFEQTAAGVQDGRARIYPTWGHGRTTASPATANVTLGFFLAARHP